MSENVPPFGAKSSTKIIMANAHGVIKTFHSVVDRHETHGIDYIEIFLLNVFLTLFDFKKEKKKYDARCFGHCWIKKNKKNEKKAQLWMSRSTVNWHMEMNWEILRMCFAMKMGF